MSWSWACRSGPPLGDPGSLAWQPSRSATTRVTELGEGVPRGALARAWSAHPVAKLGAPAKVVTTLAVLGITGVVATVGIWPVSAARRRSCSQNGCRNPSESGQKRSLKPPPAGS